MSDLNLDHLLTLAVDRVLETMFFSAALGPAEGESCSVFLEARLFFYGRPSGALGVCLSTASARMLAAGFLGEEEEVLTESQPGEVVCELANMLCGSLVSTLESEESFDLGSPELVLDGRGNVPWPETSPAACRSFEVENGRLTVTLHLELPQR